MILMVSATAVGSPPPTESVSSENDGDSSSKILIVLAKAGELV